MTRVLAAEENSNFLVPNATIFVEILLFLIIYGLFSTWAYRRTWHPLVGALANALAFAWAIAVTFPVVR